MNKKIALTVAVLLFISFLVVPFKVSALEDEINEEQEQVQENKEQEEVKEEVKEETEQEAQEEIKNEDVVKLTATNDPADNNQNQEVQKTEVHKVAVITTKVDEKGNPLKGAVLQIIDSNGNIVDEWISDGTEHESLLPEGDYVLHEKQAPNGYIKAKDKSFTVKVEINEINAGVIHDDSKDVCWHYLGVPLYYVESNGEKEEVYCINQNWEEPHDIGYNGQILTEDNILSFLPDADPTMTAKELYDKVLDIIYHRTKLQESDELSNTEIRFVTEYALKNYTSALVNNGTWARQYAYSEDSTRGYVTDPENGTTLGKLAQHWWQQHYEIVDGKKVYHKLPKKYADLFYYLISDEDHHPADMHLFIYSTESASEDGPYQNLLAVKWLDPYDEDYKVELEMVNKKAPKKETPKKTYKNPQTGDKILSYMLLLPISVSAELSGALYLSLNRKNK